MPERRFPTTSKVAGMIQAHADLLAQHGISAGVHASRPAPGTADRYYFSTDTGVWARDNGTTWDEVSGLSEGYIQGLIDTSISSHAGDTDPHGDRAYTDTEVSTNKDYIDSKVQGLDWQHSVLDELADPPGSPQEGDRYLIIAIASGAWAGHEDDIAEYNGSTWDFTSPNKGMAVYIEDVGKQKNYNGSAWVMFGSTIDHGNLVGKDDPADHSWAEETANKGAVSGYAGLNASQKVVQRNANITFDTGTDELVIQVDDI